MEENINIQNIINHSSTDEDFYFVLETFLNLLHKLDVKYCVIGSLGIQSYLKFMQHIPNDIDITVSEINIKKIIDYCLKSDAFYVEENTIANKIFIKKDRYKCYLHLIPNKMKILDKKKDIIYDRVPIYFKDQIQTNEIGLLGIDKKIIIKVPTLEYMFCFNLFGQLNTNTINNTINVLNQNSINKDIIQDCINNIPTMKPILVNRINLLKEILANVSPELCDKI